MIENFNNDAFHEWFTKNPDLMYLIKSCSNKPSSISRPILTSIVATNQAYSSSIGLNNANVGRSGRKNAVVVDSAMENKGIQESNKNAKIGSEIQLNMVIMVLASHQPITVTSTLVSASLVFVSVCHLLVSICSGRPPLFWVHLLSCVPYTEFVALSVKPFKDTQDASIYEEFFAADD